ncbi:MAG: hypothetical protein BWK80_32150 [Desulfobacteraceae bacterium IS3]|nr:MAG: hypothetical protein BWK80_32150 [Desulfobacteraceae bacterium IS3]HAO22239.1 hypothetical protein [Desulfobacteraceae bacterium]
MDTTLSIFCDELSDDVLQKITFDVCNTVNKETGATASIVEHDSGAGHRSGGAITIGEIALAAFTSGAVAAMLNIIKTYIASRPSLKFSIKKKDGDTVMIEAKNLTTAQYDQTLKKLTKALGG